VYISFRTLSVANSASARLINGKEHIPSLLFQASAGCAAMFERTPPGSSWIPDPRDARDYDQRHPKLLHLLQRLKPACCDQLPNAVDLRSDYDVRSIMPP